MSDAQHRSVLFAHQPSGIVLNQQFRLEVEGGKRLVEQEHIWMVDECAGERNALPHATR